MPRPRKHLGFSAYWRAEASAWYYSIHIDGERRRGRIPGNIPKADRKAANDAAARLYADAQRGLGPAAPDPVPSGPPSDLLTLRELLDHDITRPGIRPATRRHQDEKTRRLLADLEPDAPVVSITKATIDAYAATRTSRDGVKPRTVNMEIGILQSAWNRAHDDELLPPPPKFRQLPTERYQATFLTRDQLLDLIRAAREYDVEHPPRRGNPGIAEVIVFIGNTGLRRGELCRLTWREIDFDASLLRVLSAKRGSAASYRHRSIPLNDAALSVLRALHDSRSAYAERIGKPLDPDSLIFLAGRTTNPSTRWYRALHAAADRAGIKKRVRFHDLRHSFATHLRDRDLDYVEIARVLGHTTARTTIDLYLHEHPGRARAALDALSLDTPTQDP